MAESRDAAGLIRLRSSFDPAVSPAGYEAAGLTVTRCRHWDCDEGFKRLPYQDFKDEFTVGWDREWRMSRCEILRWLAHHGVREDA
jgi:hypothetical protein